MSFPQVLTLVRTRRESEELIVNELSDSRQPACRTGKAGMTAHSIVKELCILN